MSAELTPETQSHETTPSSTPTMTSTTSSGQGSGGGGRAGLRGMGFEAQTAALKPGGGAVQRKGNGGGAGDVHAAAAHGISGSGGSMPYGAQIQQAFGGYDISQVQAHTESAAAEGSAAMGADAYATGNHVAFGGAPDLHTAAHEAAHVVQQQAGVSLSGTMSGTVQGSSMPSPTLTRSWTTIAKAKGTPTAAGSTGTGCSPWLPHIRHNQHATRVCVQSVDSLTQPLRPGLTQSVAASGC